MSDKKKILFVDDEIELVEILVIQLEAWGFEVISASNGSEALKKVEEMPDLILLDVMMPRLNGFQVCEKLKKDPKFCHIPIIMLSAKTAHSDKKEALRCGANEYVTKPFEKNILNEVIEKCLKKEKTA